MNSPLHWLVFIQTFRITVEIILYLGFKKGLMPEQMTFSGLNFDIVTGIIALPIGYYCLTRVNKARWAVACFNVIGILLLLNVLTIAVLSMPLPIRYFMNEPSTAMVGTFPLIYLPGALVVMAYSFHIFSLRQLYLYKKAGK